jgi:gliding motility-associated-like protein
MKKIFYILSILFLSIFSVNVNAQITLDTAIVINPINCFGDVADVEVFITQSSPPTNVQLKAFKFVGFGYVPYNSSDQFQLTNFILPNFLADDYVLILVDSLQFLTDYPHPGFPLNDSISDNFFSISDWADVIADTGVVFAYIDLTIDGKTQLSALTSPASTNSCYGDCDASELVSVSGGTQPYTLNGLTFPGTDSTLLNLCAGNYPIVISDTNGCSTITSSISFDVIEPDSLSISGYINNPTNYNGEDISCFGASDGEIFALVNSGGTGTYSYSIDSILPYSPNPMFSGLSSGSYTIYYLDANNCSSSEIFTLSDPADLSAALNLNTPISCYDICDAEIEITVDAIQTGTAPYTYSINGGSPQPSSSFSSLCGDFNYNITILDANGCSFSDSISVSEPAPITFDYTISNYNGFEVSCFDISDGQIFLSNVLGGTPNYTYSIIGDTAYGSSTIYNNLSSGSHHLFIKDAAGCTVDSIFTFTSPQLFALTYAVTDSLSCYGDCDGEITAIATSQVPGIITYDLAGFPSQTSQVFNALCGDSSYTLTTTDANGCFANDTVSLVEPLDVIYSSASLPNFCATSNGEVSIAIIQGGTQPYFYQWDDPNNQTTSTATGLDAGSYEVTVTDDAGCFLLTEDVVVIDQDMILSFTTIPPCNNGDDGSATVIPNGNSPYSVLWSDAQAQDSVTATGLSPGFYTVTVIDDIGCQKTENVEVPQSAIVEISLDLFNSDTLVNCFGDPSSGVTVSASGGTGANTYMYYIPNFSPNPQSLNVFAGLFAGIYPIYTYDANGCADSMIVTIYAPDELIFTTTSSDVSCFDGADGSTYINSLSGGQPPYNFLWDNGATNSYLDSLIAGDYNISVVDDNGCTSNPATILVTINEPSQLVSSINILSNSNCGGTQATGEITVNASGATPSYTYLWNNGSLSTSISALMPATYTVTITDANGCHTSDSAEILAGPNPALDVIVQNVSCFGANDGMIYTSAVLGTPPYNFSADGGAFFVPSGTPFGPSGGAFYYITVVDAIGCSDSDSIFVYEPELLEITNINIQNISCNGNSDGELTAIHTGGSPSFTYEWDDSSNQTSSSASNLSLGNYSVIVTDSAGCTDTSSSVTISEPDSLLITSILSSDVLCFGGNDGSVTVVAEGGALAYNYSWSFGGTNNIEDSVSAGNHIVVVSDINGCSDSASIFVDEPQVISTTYLKDSVSCLNGSDGSASVTVFGGLAPYTYEWANGSDSSSAHNLSAGYNYVNIIDANLCVKTDSVEILAPLFDISIDSLIIGDISCYNLNDGSLQILASGGNYPYLYSNTNNQNSQSTSSFISLSPQAYIIYVEDDKGCFDRDTINFDQPDSLYIDSTIFSNVQCFGDNNGSINAIQAVGGTGVYTYSVNGGPQFSNSAYFNGFSAGTLTVEVFDENNCVAQDIVIINEPAEMFVDITSSNWNNYQIKCNNDSSGYADFNITGGMMPYLKFCVLLSTNDTLFETYNANIDSLFADTYKFIVKDSYGCIYEEEIIYNEPSPITHNFIASHITCNGINNASLLDSVFGGVGSANTYTYAWSTGATTYSLDNLGVGQYIINVTDENNCVSTDTSYINNINALNIVLDASLTSDVSCFDYCDGEITVNTSGGIPNINSNGTASYSYLWNDTLQQTSFQALGLCVNNNFNSTEYTCIVMDGQGCSDTLSYVLSQPEELIVSATILAQISCYSGDNGKLTASVIGGNGNNEFYWNNSINWATNPLNDNLSEGSYVVVARDSKGCVDTTEISISQPTELAVSIDEKDVSCFGFDDGEISASVTGGTPTPGIPATYDYLWTPGGQTTQTATGLSPDIYSVTVTDYKGCIIISESINISSPTNPLVINVDSIDETCALNDGEANATILGGTFPYSYNWSNGSSSNLINGLSPGLYTVQVKDDNGCEVTSSTFVNGVSNVFLPGNQSEINENICLGQSFSIEIEEKPGLTYLWSDGLNQSDRDVSPLTTTSYTLEITDPNCINSYSITANINVKAVSPMLMSNPSNGNEYPTIALGDDIELYSDNSSCDSWTWTWNNGENTNNSFYQSPLLSTWYTLTVDSSGCSGIDSIYVIVGVTPYDAITPNGDGMNDVWEIIDIRSYPNANVKVFNRWGEVIHQCSGGFNYIAWDGTYNSELLPVGTYYYVVDLNNGDEPLTGPITIIR